MKKNIFSAIIFLAISTPNILGQFWKTTPAEKLGPEVNSEAEESTPVLSPKMDILYFTRTFDASNKGGEFDQDIWFVNKDDNLEYTNAENLKELNNKLNNAVCGISADGNRLYLLEAYEGKKDLEKGLAVSEKNSSGKWGKPVKVDIPDLDIDGDFYGFYVTPDEQTIIISYEGPNTVGMEDLYVTELKNGVWSTPLHMGNVINSSKYEIAPFLSESKDTLYFSSNGHGGLGDADIFYSVKGDNWSSWSEPINLGKPFNSEKFDAFINFSGKSVYWSSNRDAERSSIFRVEILTPPDLTITCSSNDASAYQANDGSAMVTVTDGVPEYKYAWSNGSTDHNPSNLAPGEYTVTVTDDLNRTATCEVSINEPAEPIVESFEKEIYFDLNSSILNDENIKVLDEFIVKLKETPGLNIYVESHCDNRANEKYNLWLSERRLISTKKYLKENGVNPDRVKGEFKGKSEPKIDCGSNCTEEQHRINRRTLLVAKK